MSTSPSSCWCFRTLRIFMIRTMAACAARGKTRAPHCYGHPRTPRTPAKRLPTSPRDRDFRNADQYTAGPMFQLQQQKHRCILIWSLHPHSKHLKCENTVLRGPAAVPPGPPAPDLSLYLAQLFSTPVRSRRPQTTATACPTRQPGFNRPPPLRGTPRDTGPESPGSAVCGPPQYFCVWFLAPASVRFSSAH